ncbi:cytochrome P450 [Schizopora paradoxa]|uniref:Cytochrome P450 n=1 Tax=Schizopora paradoxa TaxID=27342 RepID=A0A0H2RK96_9AGAM|nr:cytochrome P450 [Schizopora paradoxa]
MLDVYAPKFLAGICAIAVSLLVGSVLRKQFTQSKKLPYPPGPRRLPLIGNFFDLLPQQLWENAVEWGKEHGDLLYLETFGQKILIVNSYEYAKELLIRRSAIYSSRLKPIISELQGWEWFTPFTPYGEDFRKHRSYQHRFVGSPETINYKDIQLAKTHRMLKAILDDPTEYGEHVHSLPGSVILMNVYGHEVEENDHYVSLGKQGAYHATNTQQYTFLEVLPWLRYLPEWFPWAEFPRVAKEVRKISHAMQYDLYRLAQKKIAQGTLRECITSVFLSENTREDGSVLDEDLFTGAAATLYMGGVDTSATVIMTFFLQMLKNPEAQRRAQLEIDDIVGAERLPTFEDMQDLPYVRGICTEVLRFAVVVPLIPAHMTTEDDVFQGYQIPAGTLVFANSWKIAAMAFNPEYFPEPHKFKPERWLQKSVQGPRPNDFVFGFGRRVCPGQDWAEKLLFIVVSSILATFSIERAIGDDGKQISPNEEYALGFLRQLGPSKCKIIPRSPKAVSLIENSVLAK